MDRKLTRQKYIYQAVLYAAFLGLMGLSWYFSGLNGSQSNYFSLKIANGLVSHFDAAPVYIKSVDAANWVIRKLAHLVEYGLMGLVLGTMLNGILKKVGLSALATLVVMSVWAVLDELHQSLVAGRYSRGLDVSLDLSGVLIAVFLVSVFVYIRKLRIQNVNLTHEVHLLTINQNIWDNLIPRLARSMEEPDESSHEEPLSLPREIAEGGF
ncbi:MAG: VanZ family protein [Syntrophomonas sp.]